jgi:hypothetical protein
VTKTENSFTYLGIFVSPLQRLFFSWRRRLAKLLLMSVREKAAAGYMNMGG